MVVFRQEGTSAKCTEVEVNGFQKGRQGQELHVEVERLWKQNECKYLGMWLKSNNAMIGHIFQIKKKAIVAMKQVWTIGQRKFKTDFRTWMMLFDAVVRGYCIMGRKCGDEKTC